MTGFDASSSELYSGAVEIQIELADGADSEAIEFVEHRILTFLKALKAGFFFPGTLHGPVKDMSTSTVYPSTAAGSCRPRDDGL